MHDITMQNDVIALFLNQMTAPVSRLFMHKHTVNTEFVSPRQLQ